MPLDLTFIQPLIEDLVLADECSVWRDPEGTSDDDLGDDLSYEPDPDATVVETGLLVSFRPLERSPQTGEAGQPLVIGEYRLAFSVEADVRNGDRIEITTCEHDPQFIGVYFRVFEVLGATFAVLKQARALLRQEAIDRP